MKRIALWCVFLGLSSQLAYTQDTSYYWDALKSLEQRLPSEIALGEHVSPPYYFRIEPNFIPSSLYLFQENMAEFMRPAQFRKFTHKKEKTHSFPVGLLSEHHPESNLRLRFAAVSPPILTLRLEKLRYFASNPKIAVDNQVIASWEILFYFDKSGNIIALFSKRIY